MLNGSVLLSNLAWMAACFPAHREFQGALRNPGETQAKVLRKLLARNANSEFGRAYGFSTIRDAKDYQARVPISTYDDLAPYINRIRNGETNVLTTEAVTLFEKTSGSSSAAKYIPYTRSLQQEFQNAVRAWICDLYQNDTALLKGRSYWLITPLSREKEVTPGGIPVGFESDAEYLGALERKIAETLFAVPGELAQVSDLDSSIYLTLRFLLQANDLTLISVWNPSYLGILMNRFDGWADRLIQDLRLGTANLPAELEIPESLKQKLQAQPSRARRLQKLLKTEGRLNARDLWPKLRLISCWSSGAAQRGLDELTTLFPGVRVQGKGLLATEGVATVPWVSAEGCLPALNSHFFEFLNENGEAKLVHELEDNAEYSLLLSTGGGFYRYRLGDRVRVNVFYGRVPILEFVGRNDGVSDLRGEKLSPAFVQSCIDHVLGELGISASFAMLAPLHLAQPCYTLYIQTANTAVDLGQALETQLRANPHYDYCRKLGQLGPLRVFWIRQGAQEIYLTRCAELGQRAGSVKPTCLHRSGGWENFFAGGFATTNQTEVEHARH